MDAETYRRLRLAVEKHADVRMVCLDDPLLHKVSFDAVVSVHETTHRTLLMKRLPAVKARAREIASRFESGESLVDIANSLYGGSGFSPTHVLKIHLKHAHGATASEIKRYLRSPELSPIEDAVRACLEAERLDTPAIQRYRFSIGNEYEYKLKQELVKREIAFVTEEELKVSGLHKTPDCLLLEPLLVRDLHGVEGVVWWIDSKAMFGDLENHAKNREQFQAYHNRYGPGLVIYWFGFLRELVSAESCVVAREFPRDFSRLV